MTDHPQVWGMLVEMRIEDVNGFDLSAMNSFRWHPHHEQVSLSRRAILFVPQMADSDDVIIICMAKDRNLFKSAPGIHTFGEKQQLTM